MSDDRGYDAPIPYEGPTKAIAGLGRLARALGVPAGHEGVTHVMQIEQVDDLTEGGPDLPPTEGLRYRLSEGARLVVRPSGTEPKLKCYLEVVVSVEEGEPGGVDAARIAATGRLDAIRNDLSAALGI